MPSPSRRRVSSCPPVPQSAARPNHSRLCADMLLLVAGDFGVPPASLSARARGAPQIALARQAAMYLAHVALGLKLEHAGGAVGRDRSTASHACRIIEDRRDDAAFDGRMARLEAACAALREGVVIVHRPGSLAR